MKWYKFFLVAALVVITTSCGVTVKSSFAPTGTLLNLDMDDLQYLGETEISVTYDTYIRVFSRIRTINGKDFDPTVVQFASLKSNGSEMAGLNPYLMRASYKVYDEFPEADYFIVTRQESKSTILILGNETESKATVKAYKIK